MVELKSIQAAAERIKNTVHKTPILTSTSLNKYTGQSVFFKAEHLQKTGAFKIRGASNCVTRAVEKGAEIVVTASSGNHGQAVAYISNELGVKCLVAVPEDASQLKVQAIQAYGAEVVYVGQTSAERIDYAIAYAAENNAVYIPPYDHQDIIAGQGTIGLEILEAVEAVDAVLVPIGGGGLISGIATAIKSLRPDIKVIGVEPTLGQDTHLSMKNKVITAIEKSETIADGLRTIQPGQVTFPIVQKYVDEIVLVEESEIKNAMKFLFERMKQVVEPSGAVTLAAILSGQIKNRHQNLVPIISGGNIALSQFVTYFEA